MMTEPDAKGSGGGDEYVDFKLKAGTSKIKRAKPGYQQMKMDL